MKRSFNMRHDFLKEEGNYWRFAQKINTHKERVPFAPEKGFRFYVEDSQRIKSVFSFIPGALPLATNISPLQGFC